jgi:hypothetical protein
MSFMNEVLFYINIAAIAVFALLYCGKPLFIVARIVKLIRL